MNRKQVAILVGLTLVASALIFGAGALWLYHTDGRPHSCAYPATTVAADVPQRAPHLATPAAC